MRLRAALRARLTPARIALAVALTAAFLGVVALVEDDGRKTPIPVDHAARLVPANALIYVHARIDRRSAQWRRAVKLVDRFPSLSRLRSEALAQLGGKRRIRDLDRQVDPWVGDEAGIALLPAAGGSARSLILLAVGDPAAARTYLAQALGPPRPSRYRGVTIEGHGRLATAFVGGFLAIGRMENVRTAIDTRLVRASAVDLTAGFIKARAGVAWSDDAPFAFAYATPKGLRSVLRSQGGVVERLARLVDDRYLESVAATVKLDENGARIKYAGQLSSTRPPAQVSADAEKRFEPKLGSDVPGSAIAYVDMRGVDRIIEALRAVIGSSSQASSPLDDLGLDLGLVPGPELTTLLRPLRGKEAALFAGPSSTAPVLTLVIDNLGERGAAMLLGRLEPLLARPSALGQVPTYEPVRIAGIDAATIKLTPTLSLTYAVIGDRAVIATGVEGIRELRTAKSKIGDDPKLRELLRERGSAATSVLFLDFERLLRLGERAGLRQVPAYQRLAADLRQIKAVRAITSSKTQAKLAEIIIEVQ